MQLINLRYLIIGIVMLAAAGLAVAITPREKIADNGPKVDLETMIPKQFGEWRVDEAIAPLQISPDRQASLDKIYNQTLSRTYIDKQGQRIMLSIAYGGDQSDSMAVHKPEVCYPAQGFQVLRQFDAKYDTGYGAIPVRRLVATQGSRIEPITYWITVGDSVAQGTKLKLEQLKYGLTGRVPDGLLFRISNISGNEQQSFTVHDSFVKALLGALAPDQRTRLIGKMTS